MEEEKVKLLSMIINTTKAKIILHSAWKYWFDDNLQPLRHEAENLLNIMGKYNLKIYDKTPNLATDEIRLNKKYSLVKAAEILSWLEVHNDVEAYIVLDDLDLKYNRIFSVIDIDYDEFLRWENVLPFYKNVKKDGVVLWKAA